MKATNEYIKDYDKSKESSHLNYWDANNWYTRVMSQKPPVNEFKWVEEASKFKIDLIESYNEKSKDAYFLEADVHYTDNLHDLHNDLPFLPERMKT